MGNGFNAETAIKVAADDISRLRQCDVFRVLEWAPADRRTQVACYITARRPELLGEVHECMVELLQG